ncbi:Myb/SANT-like DNA-binding domain-containing protein [Mycena olivaceomarginata]|nr:Myb/SANT-like DNA-binding domain-containing protein [Mycena olivaceomarginata]
MERRKNGGKRDKWTAPTLAILIRILLDEKKLGRRAESGWTSESYTKVVVALKAAGYARTAKQVKGCWTRLKGQYKIMKGMLSLSGFGWNPRSKCITATEEVWAAYLDKHPKNAVFKDRAFEHFDDMAFLCDDIMATGEDAFSNGLSGGNQDPTSDNGTGAVDDANDGGDEDEEEDEDEEDGRGVLGNILNSSSSAFSTPKTSLASASKKGEPKRSRHGRVSSTSILAGLAASVESLAASFQEESQTNSTSDSPARCDKAWNALLEDEGADLSDNEFAAAAEVFSSSKLADQYLKFPDHHKAARRVWLNNAIARAMGL